MAESTVANQSGIVRVDIEDKSALYAAYMPFIVNGGLFVEEHALGKVRHDLGGDVFLLLHLLDENERLPVAGKVVWITPRGSDLQRPTGVGIQFAAQDNGATQSRIETILAGATQSERPTHTL